MNKTYLRKPLIGIASNRFIVESGPFAGQKRIYINQDYIDSILQAGGIPFLLPLNNDKEATKQQIIAMDGIVFSGGQDIHPLRYQEEPLRFLEDVCTERDEYELSAIKFAYSLKKPILGICRGLQLINVAFGGTLFQDIGEQFASPSIQHSQKSHRSMGTHSVEIDPNSQLSRIFNAKRLITNSFHHQAVKDLAPGFFISARAKDGIIEGIEKLDSSFLLGVQWHPEMMIEKHPEMLQLFSAFVRSAVKAEIGCE